MVVLHIRAGALLTALDYALTDYALIFGLSICIVDLWPRYGRRTDRIILRPNSDSIPSVVRGFVAGISQTPAHFLTARGLLWLAKQRPSCINSALESSLEESVPFCVCLPMPVGARTVLIWYSAIPLDKAPGNWVEGGEV